MSPNELNDALAELATCSAPSIVEELPEGWPWKRKPRERLVCQSIFPEKISAQPPVVLRGKQSVF